MTDLTDLLDRASDLGETPTPIADDLARARTALRSRRRRRPRHRRLPVRLGILAGVDDRVDRSAPSSRTDGRNTAAPTRPRALRRSASCPSAGTSRAPTRRASRSRRSAPRTRSQPASSASW